MHILISVSGFLLMPAQNLRMEIIILQGCCHGKKVHKVLQMLQRPTVHSILEVYFPEEFSNTKLSGTR